MDVLHTSAVCIDSELLHLNMKKFLLLLSVLFVVSCSKDPEPIKYTLTTTVSPADSGTINPNGGTVDEGQQISVTAAPAAEYVFDKWTGAASGSDKTVSVTMDSDKSVTANFVKKKYALTTSVEGEGTVSEKVIKQGVANGTDYNSGTVVELTAIPSSGWGFKEWTGDLTGTDNPVQITIDKAKTVKAVFEELPPFYLDSNGVTIKARDWVTAGTTGQLGGVTYTAVDNTSLKTMADNDEDVTKVVTTLVTNMSGMFQGATAFNQDIGGWDVSNVTNMSGLFSNTKAFNQPIGSWDVSTVTNMSAMFNNAEVFNQDLTKWCVTNISTEPGNFNTGSDLTQANKPVWGTCPVWRGSKITFTKTGGSDPSVEGNQDRITSNVWITRGNNGGQIFNIKKESVSNKTNSPIGTKWAVGTLDQIDSLTFEKFREAVGKPQDVVGKNLVMYLEDDDVYLSVKFTSWSQGKNGGFAYERTSKP